MAKTTKTTGDGKIKIKLVRSPICTPQTHKDIVKSLGLHKLNRVVERPDTASFRGMVKKIPHLLEIVEAPTPAGAAPAKRASSGSAAPGKSVVRGSSNDQPESTKERT